MARNSGAIPCLVLAVLLGGCGNPPELPPAGAAGGELRIWRGGAQQPSVIRLEQARQAGPDPRRLALTGVDAEIPLQDGRCFLEAAGGAYDASGSELLRLDPPLRLHGWGEGGPFTGHAERARILAPGRDLLLEGVELVHAGQHQVVAELVLPEAWSTRRLQGHGRGLLSAPAPPLVVAALAALPQALPRRP